MSKLGSFALGALIGALLVAFAAWRIGADWRKERVTVNAQSDTLTELLAIQGAELVRLQADNVRWRMIAEAPDSIALPAPRPRPVTPPGYADAEVELERMTALADTLWGDNQHLRARIGRDSVKLAAYANLVSNQDRQIAILGEQLDSVTADRDRYRDLTNRAPTLGLPSFGLPDVASCAIGAAAGVLVGELVADRSLVTLSAAGVGCVVNALR